MASSKHLYPPPYSLIWSHNIISYIIYTHKKSYHSEFTQLSSFSSTQHILSTWLLSYCQSRKDIFSLSQINLIPLPGLCIPPLLLHSFPISPTINMLYIPSYLNSWSNSPLKENSILTFPVITFLSKSSLLKNSFYNFHMGIYHSILLQFILHFLSCWTFLYHSSLTKVE